jgi:hypothetical protein
MDEMNKRVLSDQPALPEHRKATHHEATENILRVQRQIALANLPHSYRLVDLATLRGKLANRDVPPIENKAADDKAADDRTGARDAKP